MPHVKSWISIIATLNCNCTAAVFTVMRIMHDTSRINTIQNASKILVVFKMSLEYLINAFLL